MSEPMTDAENIARVMSTTGIDRAGAEQALVDGKRLAVRMAKASIEAGIDDPPPAKPRRSKGTSPTQRTLAELRKRGWTAQVVEQFVRFPPPGHRVDLFGILDLIVIIAPIIGSTGLDLEPGAILGIQACAGASHAARRDKILAEPRARQWVAAGGRLELWSWSQKVARNKDGSKAKQPRWALRVETYAEMLAGVTSV